MVDLKGKILTKGMPNTLGLSFRRLTRLLCSAFLLLGVSCESRPQDAEPVSVDVILEAYQAREEMPDEFLSKWRVETSSVLTDSSKKQDDTRRGIRELSFWKKGERWGIQSLQYSLTATDRFTPTQDKPLVTTILWNGESGYMYDNSIMPARVFDDYGSFLEESATFADEWMNYGKMKCDRVYLSEILELSKSSITRTEKFEQKSASSHEIECEIPNHGIYTLLFDGDFGYVARRVTIKKKTGDFLYGEPMGAPPDPEVVKRMPSLANRTRPVSYEFEFEANDFRKTGERAVPWTVRVRTKTLYSDGRETSRDSRYTRLQFHAGTLPQGYDFKPNISENRRVVFDSFLNSGASFVWGGESVKPDVNMRELELLHQTIARLKETAPEYWRAADDDARTNEAERRSLGFYTNPYCGLYCIYALAVMGGRDIEFDLLVDPHYVRHQEGSAIEDLMQLAQSLDLHVEAFANLDRNDLKTISNPVVLHVKSRPTDGKFNHFVVYLGQREESAIILDPPGPCRLVPLDELSRMWDGLGLIISTDPIEKRFDSRVPSGRSIWAICIAAIAGSILRGVSAKARFGCVEMSLWRTVKESYHLILMACVVGLIVNVISADGVLANSAVFRQSKAASASAFIQEFTLEMLQQRLGAGEVVLVDVRSTGHFRLGHIEGAVNIPVMDGEAVVSYLSRQLPHDQDIVAYCDNMDCGYSKKFATMLLAQGFERVFVYPGGWKEWTRTRDLNEEKMNDEIE